MSWHSSTISSPYTGSPHQSSALSYFSLPDDGFQLSGAETSGMDTATTLSSTQASPGLDYCSALQLPSARSPEDQGKGADGCRCVPLMAHFLEERE